MEGFHSDFDLMGYFDIDFRDLRYSKISDMIERAEVYPVDEFIEGLTQFTGVELAMRHLE